MDLLIRLGIASQDQHILQIHNSASTTGQDLESKIHILPSPFISDFSNQLGVMDRSHRSYEVRNLCCLTPLMN